MIHIYTGDGKGKTTAALGLCFRALGWNLKICIYQFLKSKESETGEVNALKKIKKTIKTIKINRFDQEHPIFCSKHTSTNYSVGKLKESLIKSISDVRKVIKSKKYQIIVLDEIINTVSEGFIKENLVLDLIKNTPVDIELILTGRGATKKMIQSADYVTEMKEIKHPIKKKIYARKGIEF